MSNTNILLWVTPSICQNLPLVKVFEPVAIWDNDARKFTDKQESKDGFPVWEAQALLQTGWNADLTPVRVRIASEDRPQFQPNPQALMGLLNVQPVARHREG